MPEAAVELHNLHIMLSKKVRAINGITTAIPTGRITGFIGPSGAGKTTLIRAIVGRQKITDGKITVFGESAGTPPLRTKISYMTQEASAYRDLTVAENLRYFATMSGVPKRDLRQTVRDILAVVELQKQADQIVSQLSGGQKQRVSLGIALVGSPQLLVLDEPTVGLDPVLREQLWGLFRTLAAEGKTLIVSSHVMDEAERCDDLLLLREGKLLAHDTPDGICRRTGTKNVEQGFLKLVKEAA